MSFEPIQVLQNPDVITVKQCPGNIQVLKSPEVISVKQSSDSIKVLQGVQMINVYSSSRPANLMPFSFTATEQDQTVFGNLPAYPVNIVTLAITGTLQNPAATMPDFTWDGLVVTLSQGVNVGDTVYGMIQTA